MAITYPGTPLASSIQRAVAYAADLLLALNTGMLLFLAQATAGGPSGYGFFPAFLLFWMAVYYVGFGIALHASPAKLFLRIRVVKNDGADPEPDVVILRFLVLLLTIITP